MHSRTAAAGSRNLSPDHQIFRLALACSLLGGLVLWAAFPPLNLWPLACVAPLPWLYLVLRPQAMTRWGYFAIWAGSFVHWLAMLQGVRLAHLLLYPGWITLAAYLALYVPLFVWLSRVAVRRLGLSSVVAVPVVWVGLELIRGHLFTGLSIGLIAHTQTSWPALLQIADIFGAYGVSFVMMLTAAGLARMIWARQLGASAQKSCFWPVIPCAGVLLFVLCYGYLRLREIPPGDSSPPLRVALIQGSRDVHIDMTPEQTDERMTHYVDLTVQARRENAALDLVIWPESMFALPQIELGPGAVVPAEQERFVEEYRRQFPRAVRQGAEMLNASAGSKAANPPTWFWFCTTTLDYGADRRRVYNSALLANDQGEIVNRYDKTHAVMFGEYVPLAEQFPWIYDVVPIQGMSEGDQPAAPQVKGLRMAPDICFESTVPHLIRRHVVQLTREGIPPDVLVNLTNDGWFHGSALLDLHLQCGIFRAIENRRPMLIAANTGISAHIDGSGRVVEHGPKRKPSILVAMVRPDGRTPLYHVLGDWPAIACGGACFLLLVLGSGLPNRDRMTGIVAPSAHESERTLTV